MTKSYPLVVCLTCIVFAAPSAMAEMKTQVAILGDSDTYILIEDTPLHVGVAEGLLAGYPSATDLTIVLPVGHGDLVLGIDGEGLHDGSFSYTPERGFAGDDYVEYDIYDGEVMIEAAKRKRFDVRSGAKPESYCMPVGLGELAVSAAGGVTQNDADTFTLESGSFATAAGGMVDLAPDGSFVYTPTPEFVGTDTFDYELVDVTYPSIRATGRVTLQVSAGDWTPDDPQDVEALEPCEGRRFEGVWTPEALLRSATSGDLNGDSLDDLVIGSHDLDGGRGRLHVLYGGFVAPQSVPLDTVEGPDGFTISGAEVESEAGWSVVAGDWNDDGRDDLAIGAPLLSSVDGTATVGGVYVLFGGALDVADGVFDLAELAPEVNDGSIGVVVRGGEAGAQIGYSLVTGSDLNGDGVVDLAIGAPFAAANAGEIFVLYGGSHLNASPTFDLDSLRAANGGDGSLGVVFVGDPGETVGYALAAGGDAIGDATGDLVVGAMMSDSAYVVAGSPLGFGAEFELGSLRPERGGDGSRGSVSVGTAGTQFGAAVALVDVDDDSRDDVVVGSPRAEGWGQFRAGSVDIVLGVESWPANAQVSDTGFPGRVLKGYLGWGVVPVGDSNADGVDDFVAAGAEVASTSFALYLGSSCVPDRGFGATRFVGWPGALAPAGDFNGDGRDDFVVFLSGGSRDAIVVFGTTEHLTCELPVS